MSTITVQLCMMITASLDLGTNSDPESGRGLDSETASDGCSGILKERALTVQSSVADRATKKTIDHADWVKNRSSCVNRTKHDFVLQNF
jgi:hypothetical protein